MTVLIFVLGTFSLGFIIPAKDINLTQSLLIGFDNYFHYLRISWASPIIAVALMFGVLAGVLTWVSGPSKGIFAVGRAGYLPPFFQKSNKNGVQRVLYLCMGLSLGRLIVRRQHKGIIRLWVLQLIANFLWSILFFTLRNPLAGFIDIVLLNILVGLYIFAASRRDRAAAWLFVSYLLWTLFAAYLNGYILLHGTPATTPTTIQTESLTISKPKTERIMVHKMPELPYSTEALAPKMSKETFEYHYGKHLQTYVDNLNRLIPGTPYESMSLQEIVKKADGPIFNNAAQTWNHTFFFLMLTPDQKPMPQKLADRIARDFGSVEAFKEEFSKAATGLFGSGWTWLAADKDGKLQIISESNAGNPMTKGLKPVMTIDVWEHAYYIDYRNRRADFIKSYWELIDWDKVADRVFPRKYHCTACDYVYDPAKGDPESGIAPGTAFEDIPDDWVCPVCGLYKDSFKIVEEK